MNLKERANKIKCDIPAVFIALKKKETPALAKVFAGITVMYAFSPIDFIPDIIPVIGLLDDIILLPILIAITIKFIPKVIFEECRIEAEGLCSGERSKKWYFGVPIILIWILLITMIIKLFIL